MLSEKDTIWTDLKPPSSHCLVTIFLYYRFILLGVIGGRLCGFSKEDGLIPINKNLWSVSFILTLASMAFLLLTVMYLLVDVADFWSGSPLIYVGMNPILVSAKSRNRQSYK